MASAVARAYIGGLGAQRPLAPEILPPSDLPYGRAPVQGVRGAKPPEAES